MARNIAGGTNRIAWNTVEVQGAPSGVCSFALRFRTTQNTLGVQLAARWSATSRSGWGLLLDPDKVRLLVYSASASVLNIIGTTVVNDGNWHTLVATIPAPTGATARLYIDGAQDASGNLSNNMGNNNSPVTLGDSYDAFWPTYNGDVADMGYWFGETLTADEAAAYNKGVSAARFRQNALEVLYAPLVRDHQEKYGAAIATSGFSGTTVVDHPRVIGSLV